MPRFFLQVSFDGTAYHGWQLQDNANTIQAEIEKGLQIVFQEIIRTTGCGRTDSGVHAKIFYLHFDIEREINPEIFIYKINRVIPKDIAISNIMTVQASAHARFDATSREYQYFIHRKKNPFLLNHSTLILKELDIKAMNDGASELLKHKDFTSFSKLHSDNKTNFCEITHAEWTTQNDQIIFTIRSDRFLRNMVRALVGTLLEIGEGKLNPDDLQKIFEANNRSAAKTSAPAHGLFLTNILYPYI